MNLRDSIATRLEAIPRHDHYRHINEILRLVEAQLHGGRAVSREDVSAFFDLTEFIYEEDGRRERAAYAHAKASP